MIVSDAADVTWTASGGSIAASDGVIYSAGTVTWSEVPAEQIMEILEDLGLDPFEELPKDPDRALVDVCNALKSYPHRAFAWLYAITLLDIEGGHYQTLCDDLDSDRAKVAKRRWQMRLKEIVRLGR